MIDQYLEVCDNDHELRLLKFVLEEVELVLHSKHIRRYSVELILMYILHATSPRAYKRLLEKGRLVPPSVKTLWKITMRLDRKSGLDNTQYLRMRYSQLNAFDRNVILMIDKIYVSKRIEVATGHIFGLTEDCEVASTALCFMIKSLSRKYRDIVCIHPVRILKAETQKQCFDKVMHLVYEVGFNVIEISVGNAAANRKFYKDFLCDSAWKEAITNNFTGGKIFLIFDRTHVIKNIYNNFLAKRVFKLPNMHCFVPAPLTPSFADVETVYNNECKKPLQIAHKLSETVLKPNSIEKVNVNLALSLLHASTINALKHYGFYPTAAVLELFAKLWSILNVSSPTIGKRKQDIFEMRQLYESDRKLRTISLLKHSQIFLKEIKDAAKAREERTAIQEVIFRAESFYADMSFNIMPTENDISDFLRDRLLLWITSKKQ